MNAFTILSPLFTYTPVSTNLDDSDKEIATLISKLNAARCSLNDLRASKDTLNTQLSNVLALSTSVARDTSDWATLISAWFRFHDAYTYDRPQTDELQIWIMQLQNKLSAKESAFLINCPDSTTL